MSRVFIIQGDDVEPEVIKTDNATKTDNVNTNENVNVEENATTKDTTNDDQD